MLKFRDFIQDFVFNTNHHLNLLKEIEIDLFTSYLL